MNGLRHRSDFNRNTMIVQKTSVLPATRKTVFVWIWANMFYAHRQKKWVKLLENKGMDDKQKSKSYFNRHSSTIINRNGYWSYDYRITSKILMKRNVKKLIDIGCGNGAFLEMFHEAAPSVKLSGLDLSREMEGMLRAAGFRNIRSRMVTPFSYVSVGDFPSDRRCILRL